MATKDWDDPTLSDGDFISTSSYLDHVTDQKSRSKVFTGTGDPNGVVTPEGIGDIYVDTSTEDSYINTDGTINGWTASAGTLNPTYNSIKLDPAAGTGTFLAEIVSRAVNPG